MPTIMVVDDSEFIRTCITNLLTKHNYKVIQAKDGAEAVQTYCLAHPEVVLMDFAMPVKNGLIALAEIRQFDPQAKVIMLTALDQQAIILRAMQSGAKDFLVKPYDSERVLKTLQKVLG